MASALLWANAFKSSKPHGVFSPLMMNGKRLGVRLNPPKAGEQTNDILSELGYSVNQIQKLSSDGVVA